MYLLNASLLELIAQAMVSLRVQAKQHNGIAKQLTKAMPKRSST
jgi:hypothetical protein